MKKLSIIIFLFCFIPNIVCADSRVNVKFNDCVDGDTAKFIMDGEIIKVRFLAIDTPETKNPKKGIEKFGEEASTYTCNKLKKAKKIILEFDNNSDLKDKYNRYLAWIFVDDSLLQQELVTNGLAQII